MKNFIINYWSQVAVIIAAIGYLCKVLLDSSFKRKEIGYTIYAKERLNAIANFLSTYEKAQMEVRVTMTIISSNVNKGKNVFENIEDYKPTLELLKQQMRHSRLFLNSEEFELFFEATEHLDMVDLDLALFNEILKEYNLPIKEAVERWQEEHESRLNEDEAKLEGFIDTLGKKYNRRFW